MIRHPYWPLPWILCLAPKRPSSRSCATGRLHYRFAPPPAESRPAAGRGDDLAVVANWSGLLASQAIFGRLFRTVEPRHGLDIEPPLYYI